MGVLHAGLQAVQTYRHQQFSPAMRYGKCYAAVDLSLSFKHLIESDLDITLTADRRGALSRAVIPDSHRS